MSAPAGQGEERGNRWREVALAWNRPAQVEVAVALVFATTVLLSFARFLAWVERRPGVVLADPLLASFAPVDLGWLTFGVLYASVLALVAAIVPRPARLAVALETYATMFLVRWVAMYLTPLAPPVEMIPLVDPFVQLFSPDGQVLTRDLFFSGHTASMTVFACVAPSRAMKIVLGLGAVVVATCVVLQKVHYGVDVLVAPFVAYSAWRFVTWLRAGLGLRAPE